MCPVLSRNRISHGLWLQDKMYFQIITLGCKINQYESQALAESLMNLGLLQVDNAQGADTVIINSCAVTSRAVRDLKKTSRQTARLNPEAKIIITGCAAQVLEGELSLLPEVDMVIPQKKKVFLLKGLDPVLWKDSPPSSYAISNYFRARAVVKVQDGCSHKCTYCIVPLTRGESVSRMPGAILDEIVRLADKGFGEIILGGINLRLYGRDIHPPMDFWDLVDFLHKKLYPSRKEKLRIRLSSLEPSELTRKGLDILAGCSMLCPHLHISLQSGSPKILKRMNRGHYHPLDLMGFSQELKSIWPVYSMGADILAGFPGETRADFQQTLELVQSLPLSYAHIFPYSPRPGTPAAGFSGQVSPREKKSRTSFLNDKISRKKKDFIQRLTMEKELNLIMESRTGGMSEYYVECRLTGEELGEPGQTVRVRPVKALENRLIVQPVPPWKTSALNPRIQA